MPYNVSFISLGCAKNQVNCEQMMATVQHAGHNVVLSPEGADVAVVNTCGFLASACEEAIARVIAQKTRGRALDEKGRKRLSDMLLRRGFAWRDVRAAIAQISENATEFDYEE